MAIVAMAAAVRVAVVLALHDHPLLQPRPGLDSGMYLDLAKRVAAGDLLSGDRVFFVSPFYVYFAAAVLALSGGSVLALQVVQALLGAVAAWFVGETARLWFGQRAAWLAAGLAAATGFFAFQESLVLQSSVDPLLTAAGLWALARAWSHPRWHRFLLAGAILGVHVLNRPNVLIWAVTAAVLSLWHGRRRAARLVPPSSGFALVLGLALALLPVAARNYAVAGELALTSSHGGLNLYIGNNERADGTYRPVDEITPAIEGQGRDMREVAGRAMGRPVTDVEASSWFYRQAADWMLSRPVAAAVLFAKKLAFVFNAEDIPLNDSYTYYATDVVSPLRVLIVGPWVLLPLGVAGIWLARPSVRSRVTAGASAAWWRWVSFIPVYAVSVALFFVTGRYRLPILVACAVTAAGCLVNLWDRWQSAGWRGSVRAVAGIAALMVAVNLPLGLDSGLAGWRTEMLLHHVERGEVEQAEALLARTEPTHPNPPLLLYRVGRALRQHGDYGRALAVLERARASSPDRRELDLEIGETIVQMGRSGEGGAALAAIRGLRAPEELDPRAQAGVGQLALEFGDAGLAEPWLARAAAAMPGSAQARESHALALAGLGRQAEAATALEEAARLDPSNPGVRMNLAILYAQAGRFADARRQATEALAIRPDDQRAREFLASLPGR